MDLLGIGSVLKIVLGELDWVVVLTFIVIALITFLAPVVGYRQASRTFFLTSLWILLGLMGLMFLQIVLIQLALMERPSNQLGVSTTGFQTLLLVLNVLKAACYLVALVLFLIGLQTLGPVSGRSSRNDDEGYVPPPIRSPGREE